MLTFQFSCSPMNVALFGTDSPLYCWLDLIPDQCIQLLWLHFQQLGGFHCSMLGNILCNIMLLIISLTGYPWEYEKYITK